jgi:3'(2'), 5'-bisphosphate nucleotidase
MDYADELAVAERAARGAGELVATYYERGPIAADEKPDGSPVTEADRAAGAWIAAVLRAAFPGDWILSEEDADDPARLHRRRVWIVDPLDGTRDFVARTGQFSVHVGLAVDGAAVVGAVYQPVSATMYAAAANGGAWRTRGRERARLAVSSAREPAALRVGTTRLNATSRLSRFLADTGLDARSVAMGASVKHMAMTEGALDACVNLSPGEQEWDTCAPEVVIREAGGAFTDGDGRPFRYNQPDLGHYRGSIASNGACHGALVELLRPYLTADTR